MKNKRIVYLLIIAIFIFACMVKSYAVTLPNLEISSNNYSKGDKVTLNEVNTVEAGKTLQLYAIIEHGNDIVDKENPDSTGWFVDSANLSDLTWTSSDTTIATIDNDGKLTGIKEGKTTITVNYALAKNESERIATKEFEVTKSLDDNKKITKDLVLNSYSSNNEITYGSNIKKDGENILLSVKATDFNLPSNLYEYSDYIRLRVTYNEEDYKVCDCKVINYKTGMIIEDLSEENINRLFNIEYGKEITEKSWSDTIKLSDIKENVIYKYTASSTTQFPKIQNDIGKNCIIYIKEKDNKTYEKRIDMFKQFSSSSVSIAFNEYNSGDSFNIMYKTLDNSELIDLIEKDEIIYLSKYKDGDKLEYEYEKYIYNDTNRNIAINTKSKVFGIEKSDSIVIGKGEIYGFDWMVDSATISYLEDNNNEEKKDSVNVISKDNTIIPAYNLPKTGLSNIIFLMILSAIIIILVVGIKFKNFKDVE